MSITPVSFIDSQAHSFVESRRMNIRRLLILVVGLFTQYERENSMKKCTFAIQGIVMAFVISTFITTGKMIWNHYWLGWVSYLVLLICVTVITGTVGFIVDTIKITAQNRNNPR